uniref:Uncharacterized protein n=1 Tax=Panthera tigris altaica TaxID=74533 RepID=A0A8C9M8Q1_PANTA
VMWLMGAARYCSEEPLPGCDVGKLQQPNVSGLSRSLARSNGSRGERSARTGSERIPKFVWSR